MNSMLALNLQRPNVARCVLECVRAAPSLELPDGGGTAERTPVIIVDLSLYRWIF